MDKPRRIKFFTTVNAELWQAYAERTTRTWRDLDRDIHWENPSQEWHEWRQGNLELRPEPDFQHTWQRFSHKVETQCRELPRYQAQGYDLAVWLDADAIVCRPLETLPQEAYPRETELCTYLGRGPQYPETGWIAYNLHHRALTAFVSHLQQIYLADGIFELEQWHDAWVWNHVREQLTSEARSITDNRPGEAFGRSLLREHMIHVKGPRKDNVRNTELTWANRRRLMQKTPK